MSALGTDNNDANSSKITFDTKDSKLYVLAVILLGKHNQNYQNFLAKDLKDQCIGINMKQKVIQKIKKMSTDILSNQTL